MRTLVIGGGEVGTALYNVIKDHHECYIRDLEDTGVTDIDCLQICYPDHRGFIKTTNDYINQYNPSLVVINSSITVGTCEQLDEWIVYSPVRGRHPKLIRDLKLYPKFIFCKDKEKQKMAKKFFEKCGIQTELCADPTTGEILKLISNVHMGLEIAWRQEVDRMLKKFKVNPLIYEKWEETYRKGYERSNDINLIRPAMRPNPIGGHCIIPCTEILAKSFKSKAFEFIIESNNKRIKEQNKGETNDISNTRA